MYTLTEIYEAADTLWEAAQGAGGPPAPLLKTGQALCYNAGGTLIEDCTGTGQDGEYQAGIPRDYENNNDGTVTDHATGLMWQRCSRGQNNDAGCTGTATTANWETALSYCNTLSLATYNDWRLPNATELYSLIDHTRAEAPVINVTYFPNTVQSSYWSSTYFSTNVTTATTIGFHQVNVHWGGKTGNLYTRCVRG